MLRLIGLAVIGASGLFGCTQERSIGHIGASTALHMVLLGEPVSLVSVNTDNDSVEHVFDLPSEWYHALVAADVGSSRLLLSHNNDVRLYSSVEDTSPVSRTVSSARFAFTRHPDIVIGSQGSEGGVVEGQLNIYSYSEMSVAHTDSIGLVELAVAPRASLVAGIASYNNLGGPPFSSRVYVYDYIKRRMVRLRQLCSPSGAPLQLWRCGISPDGSKVYLGASEPNGVYLVCYSPDADSILFQKSVNVPFGDPQVTPDGSEVWYPDAGIPALKHREMVRVFSTTSGQNLAEIDLADLRTNPFRELTPLQIRFTPDGSKAYVLCQDYGGPLVVVDTQSRTRTDLIVPDSTRILFLMDLGSVSN